MTTERSTEPLEQAILTALQQGDKNRGQLFDLTGTSYPLLVQALQHLKHQNRIETDFVPDGAVFVLTYRLRPTH